MSSPGTMSPRIAAGIRRIARDRIHGASWLAREALGVAKLATRESRARTAAAFVEDLRITAGGLMEARPTMAPIANYVARFLHTVLSSGENLEALKDSASTTADELIKEGQGALGKVALAASELMEKGDRLLTCSYSSTVCQAIIAAKERGKDITVVIAESRSARGRRYGELAAKHLRSRGIPVEVIPDEAIGGSIAEAHKALVGADSILWDGSLINGTPTHEVALAARERGVPLYCLGEVAKFNVFSYLGQEPVLEEGFQRIPGNLITAIVTERGVMEPGEVTRHMQDMERYFRPLRHKPGGHPKMEILWEPLSCKKGVPQHPDFRDGL